jgi:hypothetical protein
MTYDRVRSLLEKTIPPVLVHHLLTHHHDLKVAFLTGDSERCLLKGGKVAEVVMKIVRFFRDGSQAKSISVDSEIKLAENAGNLLPELRTLVPRHARVLYDHRSKRGGGHTSFDPNDMDSHLVVAVADWVLGELLRLYGGMQPDEASGLVRALVGRQVPLVEEIDGDFVALLARASAREEIELVLWRRYPARTSVAELNRWLPTHSANSIRAALTRMKQAKDVHANEDGTVLTAKGLGSVEEKLRERAAARLRRP